MPNARPVMLEIVDVFEGGELVLSLDTDRGAHAAAEQFANWWEGGIIRQALSAEAPAPSAEDREKIVNRDYLSTCEFRRRYMDGSRKAYPESLPDARRSGYRDTTATIKAAINSMCTQAWTRGEARRREQDRERVQRLAITDAQRYVAGLARVAELTAMDELREKIAALDNEVVRRQLMSEFPELFSPGAAEEIAEQARLQDYEANVTTWRDATMGAPTE